MTISAADALPDQLLRTQRFTAGVPARPVLGPDGAVVAFLRSKAGDDKASCLWALDVGPATERLLADPAALSGQAVGGAGITGYAISHDADVIAFVLAGELWTVGLGAGPARKLVTPGPVSDPRPDPAGRLIGYVSAGALRVIGTDGTGDRVVAAPDGPEVSFGSSKLTGEISPADPRGYWWSPDGTRLLVVRSDIARLCRWHVADPADPAAEPRAERYPAAGTANPDDSLWIAEPAGGRVAVHWDLAAFEYLVGAGWDSHGPYAVVQARDQRTAAFLSIDPATGQTVIVAEQHDDCWVQLIPGLPARTSQGAIISHTDVADTRHLTIGGAVVTPPGLQLRAVLGVEGDEVLFTASDDPEQVHLWTYRPGAGIRQLSTEAGVHSGIRRAGTLVHVARRGDRPDDQVAVLRAGQPAIAIESLAERPVLGLHATRLVLGPRELRAVLFLPSWHQPGSGKLPVLADPYGGPAVQRVTADLDSRELHSQWFAEQGFAVLVADGSGTPGRGPRWEREVHGDLYGPVLDDQVTALHEAARLHPDLDLGRVGIRGWSFGGSLAAVAVLRRPDVFHAAVAGAGVTDQRLYNTHWRERFLGHPDEFPQRYDDASLVLGAPKLTRPLLLIHGLADTNVFPAHTLRLSAALLAAGRPHEVLLLPGVGHNAMAESFAGNLLRHQAEFLKRSLPAPA